MEAALLLQQNVFERTMKIEFHRTGGFSGRTIRTTVDTDELHPDESRKLQDLISKLELRPIQQKADRFTYVLKVSKDASAPSTFEFGEGSNQDLVKDLTERANQRPPC